MEHGKELKNYLETTHKIHMKLDIWLTSGMILSRYEIVIESIYNANSIYYVIGIESRL